MDDLAQQLSREPRPADPQIREMTQQEIKEFEALIDSWINASPEEQEEQRETGEYLRRVLDEDRTSYRKHFE